MPVSVSIFSPFVFRTDADLTFVFILQTFALWTDLSSVQIVHFEDNTINYIMEIIEGNIFCTICNFNNMAEGNIAPYSDFKHSHI